jgi:hypothetical protein
MPYILLSSITGLVVLPLIPFPFKAAKEASATALSLQFPKRLTPYIVYPI